MVNGSGRSCPRERRSGSSRPSSPRLGLTGAPSSSAVRTSQPGGRPPRERALAGAGRPRRAPQEGIPATRDARERILVAAREPVAERAPAPPLSFEALHELAGEILAGLGLDEGLRNWVTVLVNGESWRERYARVPFSRRLLLLPQCLRDAGECPGQVDELGLVCRGCGRCAIDRLRREAENLGYVVLVSEGTAAVLAMVQSGQIEAFVGSSCMSALEKVFPVVSLAGVPAIAIPLLYDGCSDTALDEIWLLDAIRLTAEGPDEGGGP